MNLPYIPPPRSRDVAQEEFNRRVAERLQQLQLLESTTIQMNQTPNGITVERKDLGGGGADGDQVWL